jgi:dTDP-4-amino-4,6-dideoxygalactose transaminase
VKIPFLNLKAEYEGLKREIDSELQDVLESGYFVLGEKVRQFESEFAKYLGVKHVVAVNSGTSALYLALRALKIGPGDEVITAANTFVATCEAIAMTGATPRLVDVLPSTCDMDPDKLEQALTGRTRAVIPVHLYGLPAEMDDIVRIADSAGIHVVEDAAQAHGAEYGKGERARKAGSLGTLGCFSFYPSKNLGCYGEGGAVAVDDGSLFERVVMLRDHGQTGKNVHVEVGGNYRMSAFQGAVLGVKLKRLDRFNETRIGLAGAYSEALSGSQVGLPLRCSGRGHVYHLYVIQTEKRDALREHLTKEGIGTGIHYPYPVHLLPAFEYLGYNRGDFPVSEKICDSVLSLPMYPQLKEEEARLVGEVAADFIQAF